MKYNINKFFVFFIVIWCSCYNKNEVLSVYSDLADTIKNDTLFFPYINDYPDIKDTSNFIKELLDFCKLEINDLDAKYSKETINKFEKINIWGSEKDYYLIEYDYKYGCMATFPWRYQFIFSDKGKLIKVLWAIRYEMIDIFPNENPLMLAVVSTAGGNGGHSLYKIENDSFVDILERKCKTYKASNDNFVFEPYELNLKITDNNNDGYNDLIFYGNILLINGLTNEGVWYDYDKINGEEIFYSEENPFKKFDIKYIFQYNPKSKHFVGIEDYDNYIYEKILKID